MNRTILVCAALAGALALPGVLCGGTFTLKPGATVWDSDSSYEEPGGPSSGDTVKIPADVTASVDDDSIAFVSSLGAIFMPSSTSALTIDISTNATLGCQVTAMSDVSNEGSGSAIGTVTKKGAGELYLAVGGTSSSYRSQYYVNWDVKGGSIRMPTNSASSSSQLYFGAITVEEGATLYTANPGRVRVAELWGSGTVTNVSAGTSNALDVYGFGRTAPSVFSGVIGGGLYMYSRGNVNLIGTNNTFTGDCWAWNCNSSRTYGTTGLKKLGMAGDPSSAGAGSGFRTREYSGRFLYLGTGETTDKTFQFDESSSCPCEFDAGAVGGVTFTGKWKDNQYSTAMNRIVITGSNTVECVLDNAFNSNYGYRLTKKGAGMWRLRHNADRNNTGVVAVEDGTLKFDSIAPAGTVCALGKSTVLYADYTGAKSNDMKVPYALSLGGDSSKTGTLEYAGSDAAFCTNRLLMVTGVGRFRVSGGALTFGGAYAGPGGGTLVFDAANGVTNTLANVADGTNGTLSIVKEGNGALKLESGQTWSGALDVRAGTVIIDNRWEYFRFRMKENGYACTNRYDTSGCTDTGDLKKVFNVSEFCLYDAAGTRLNAGLVAVGERSDSQYPSASYSATALEPGQAAIENGQYLKYYFGSGTARLADLFDGSIGSGNGSGISIFGSGYGAGIPYIDLPNRQCRIVMRLPEGSGEAAYYDIAAGYGMASTSFGRALTAYSVEASRDGVNWVVVAEDNAAEIPATNGGWYGDSTTHTTLEIRHPGGMPLANVSAVSVSPNATLVAKGFVAPIRKLVLNTAGAGAIDGFEFAADGVLEIDGAFAGSASIPLAVRNSGTFSNVANWSVTSGGKERDWSVKTTASGVVICKRGTMMIVL